MTHAIGSAHIIAQYPSTGVKNVATSTLHISSNELDTTGVEPMSHVFPVQNVFREDVVVNGDDRENILKNAPEEKDGSFVVPKTVD